MFMYEIRAGSNSVESTCLENLERMRGNHVFIVLHTPLCNFSGEMCIE